MIDYYVHESSYLDEDVKIGEGTRIWHFCHLMQGCRLGSNCSIGQNVVISPGVILGNGVKVQNNVSIYSGVICEDDVFLGPSMVFTNVINPRAFIERKDEFKTTLIKKGASIGANATIVCGNNIGSYAFIGAGSVVSRDVPDYGLVYGNPARLHGWVCRCGEKLKFHDSHAICEACNYEYKKINAEKIIEKKPSLSKKAIPMLDLVGQYKKIEPEINQAITGVLNSGNYIMGPQVKEFEDKLAQRLNVKHAIGVASGSDALMLSLHALGIGPGDKVLVPTFTFFATAGAVSRLGGIPLFVDIDPTTFNLDLNQVEDILSKDSDIKAIIPVHLFGLPADMPRLMNLAKQHNLIVVEDACQAINADIIYAGPNQSLSPTAAHLTQKAGTVGDTGCFSFFSSKNLGCFGDGGAIVTNNEELAEKIRILRVHGSKPKYYHKVVGYNSRLDTIQAAILNVKLKYLNEWTQKRRDVARRYNEEFVSQKLKNEIKYPEILAGHVFHQYVIEVENRDELVAYLQMKGINTAVYYPIPLHLQQCFESLGYRKGDLPAAEKAAKKVLALPIDPELNQEQVSYIVARIKDFVKGER